MEKKRQYRIDIEVRPTFEPDLSDIELSRYVFFYDISMKNNGNIAGQLLTRYWFIIEEQMAFEVQGAGVVGEFPILQPSQSFQYRSSVSLSSPHGKMQGFYEWLAFDGTIFRSTIPVFELLAQR